MYKPSFPYLVDISITKKCLYGCTFCYQSSESNGVHGNTKFISETLANVLFKSKVFEIVLGGGEPTLHPDLITIIKAYKNLNFRVSITTKNYSLQLVKDIKELIDYCDFIAFSCNSMKDLLNIKSCIDSLKQLDLYLYNKIGIQTILGLIDFKDTLSIIEKVKKEWISNYITLLGYKNYGRGKDQTIKEIPETWIIDIKNLILEEDYNSVVIGADSVIIDQYKDKLLEIGVEKKYLLAKEGVSTCYIDAVTYKIHPSSFTDHFIQIDNNLTASDFKTIFKRFI
jgi:MoaA/NifB/PqqE/SkfB family radical SAM enzyme